MKADHQSQLAFEHLFNKNQLMVRLRREFRTIEILNYLKDQEIPEKFGIDLLVQMVLHKRASVNVLVGILHHYFDDLQACADMLLRSAEADLVDYSEISKVFILKYDVSQDVYDDLDRYQYPLPMLIEPQEITDNSHNGYLSVDAQTSIILKRNHHTDDVCLDHINRCNRVKYSINVNTAQMVKNQWKNLDKQKPGEEFQDYQARVKAFEKYDSTCKDVFDHLMQYDNEFYLTHRYDKRGRTYCQGYHVNYAGNEWNKACIEFADKELVQLT